MSRIFLYLNFFPLIFLVACNPLGGSPSSSSSYTPGLSTIETGATTVSQATMTLTMDAQTNATPSSNQTVNVGTTKTFVVTANTGYTVSSTVGGTCPTGSWSGSSYTSGVINIDCTISFSSVAATPAGGLDSSWTPSFASLIAYWSLEETAYGTVNGGSADFADSGPVATHHGTHSGTISYGATGKTGNAVNFSNSGCITIPASISFNSSTLTAMAWIKTTNTSIGNILSFYNGASSYQGWALLLNNVSGKASFWGGTSNGFKDSSSSIFTNGSWHHLAAVANNTSLKLYVDGALDSTHVITAIPAYNGPGVIGADGDCLQKITATIDEMAVWNVALSTADINTIYTYQNTH